MLGANNNVKERTAMKKKTGILRSICAFMLTVALTVSLIGTQTLQVKAATHGPNSGETAFPFIIVSDGITGTIIYNSMGEISSVKGLSYDKNTNTLTMNNYTGAFVNVNEMGDDFKLKVLGTNTISQLLVWGYGYNGSVKITGNGTLNIKNTDTTGIELRSEISPSQLYVDKGVTINISCGTNAVHISETTHSTPIKLASGVTLSSGNITNTSYKLPKLNSMGYYSCSKNGTSYSMSVFLGNSESEPAIEIFDNDSSLVESIPWDCITVPSKLVEKAGYTVDYGTTALKNSDIAVKKLTISYSGVPNAAISSATGSKKAITVKLKKASGAKGYQIRYATNKKMSKAKSVTTTGVSKKIKGLKAKTKYYVQARAYKTDAAGKKTYGTWSATKTVTTK